MSNKTKNISYKDWNAFIGEDIPSSVKTFPLLLDKAKPDSRIVDIGCGFGRTCFELLSGGCERLVGFDINKTGIEFASEKLRDLPNDYQSRCKFVVDDALNTSFADEQFDLGVMQAFLTTMTNLEVRQKALREARRIIKKGGGLYLAVFIQTWHQEKYREKYEVGHKETGELGSFNAYDKDSGEWQYQAHHYTEQEIVYLLTDVGFKIDLFEYQIFTTRSGNKVNGATIWAI